MVFLMRTSTCTLPLASLQEPAESSARRRCCVPRNRGASQTRSRRVSTSMVPTATSWGGVSDSDLGCAWGAVATLGACEVASQGVGWRGADTASATVGSARGITGAGRTIVAAGSSSFRLLSDSKGENGVLGVTTAAAETGAAEALAVPLEAGGADVALAPGTLRDGAAAEGVEAGERYRYRRAARPRRPVHSGWAWGTG